MSAAAGRNLQKSSGEINASAQKRYEEAVATQEERASRLVLFERLFISCSLLCIATIFITGRSLARYVTAERLQAALQQSLFDAANQADLKGKQALLDSIQHAQSRLPRQWRPLADPRRIAGRLAQADAKRFRFHQRSTRQCRRRGQRSERAPLVKNVARGATSRHAGAADQPPAKELEVVNLLILKVLISKQPLISNDLFRGSESRPRQPDQPLLTSLLALPIMHGELMLGIVGVANRPGGYDAALADFLQPLVSTCGKLFYACANEQRQRQADLERQKFVFLVENSSDCIGMATLDGRMFYLNPGGRQLLGLATDTPIHETCLWDFYFEGGETFFREKALPSLESTGRWEGEVLVRDHGAHQAIAVFQNVFLVSSDDQSEPLYVAVVNRDITENKKVAKRSESSQGGGGSSQSVEEQIPLRGTCRSRRVTPDSSRPGLLPTVLHSILSCSRRRRAARPGYSPQRQAPASGHQRHSRFVENRGGASFSHRIHQLLPMANRPGNHVGGCGGWRGEAGPPGSDAGGQTAAIHFDRIHGACVKYYSTWSATP